MSSRSALTYRLAIISAVVLLCFPLVAKEQPLQTITWPESGTPILRFSFAKFKEIGSVGGQRSYLTETTVENLWSKAISNATFSVYLFDKNKTRIGEGYISLTNVPPGQMVKFQTTLGAAGSPVSLSPLPSSLPRELAPAVPAKRVSITINSVPQGALLKVDGNELGTTPKIAQLSVGKHLLEFSKEGFNSGTFPVSGGSVSYELGTSAQDTNYGTVRSLAATCFR